VLVGNRGPGKSTLVNCLRGLGPKHPDLAPVGEVNTTMDCNKYDDLLRKGKPIVLYDMLGAGVTSCSAWDYYYARKVFCFDMVIIAHDTTLTEVCACVLVPGDRICMTSYLHLTTTLTRVPSPT